MKDLPKWVVKISYKGEALAEQRVKKGDQLDNYTRYLYVYQHEDLNERMSKAWREDAKAEVYLCSPSKTQSVAATKPRGIWK